MKEKKEERKERKSKENSKERKRKEMSNWRVKLYQLETGGVWIDKGTGFVTCSNVCHSFFSLARSLLPLISLLFLGYNR